VLDPRAPAPGGTTKGTSVKVLPTARAAAPVALVLGAALALSGCGPQQAGAAAIVGDRVISDQDVQTAAQETNKGVEGLQQPFTASDTLVFLIVSPYVLDAAAKGGHGVSESQAKAALTKLPNPSPATLEFARTFIALQGLTQEQVQGVLAEVQKAKITVNPRYGKLDPKTLRLDTSEPNWIKKVPQANATTAPSVPSGQ
jgi:hypothetical protein